MGLHGEAAVKQQPAQLPPVAEQRGAWGRPASAPQAEQAKRPPLAALRTVWPSASLPAGLQGYAAWLATMPTALYASKTHLILPLRKV